MFRYHYLGHFFFTIYIPWGKLILTPLSVFKLVLRKKFQCLNLKKYYKSTPVIPFASGVCVRLFVIAHAVFKLRAVTSITIKSLCDVFWRVVALYPIKQPWPVISPIGNMYVCVDMREWGRDVSLHLLGQSCSSLPDVMASDRCYWIDSLLLTILENKGFIGLMCPSQACVRKERLWEGGCTWLHQRLWHSFVVLWVFAYLANLPRASPLHPLISYC